MLSKKAKYALKALVALASDASGRPRPAAEIAAQERIPGAFLELILLELKGHGFVQSRRGARGGYSLARPAARIRVGEVLRATDGPLAPLPCVSRTSYRRCEECVSEATCGIRRVMERVRDATSGILDRATLAEIAAGDRRAPSAGRRRPPAPRARRKS